MLLAKKVFYEKMFRDPKNGGSDQVKTDLRPTGVPKKLISLKFEKNLKCDFGAEGVLLSKKVFYEKMFRNPKNHGVRIGSKLTCDYWVSQKNAFV